MTYVTPSGEQFVVVAAGGHRELRDKVGDYIVAFALRDRARPQPASPPLSSGRYEGHIVLDRTRLRFTLNLDVAAPSASATFVTDNPRVEGHGTGRAVRDSVIIGAEWTFAAQHCSGTMQLRATTANGGGSVIGELEYVDGCSDHRTKPGTFAARRARQ
jgi:hypothetical protein